MAIGTANGQLYVWLLSEELSVTQPQLYLHAQLGNSSLTDLAYSAKHIFTASKYDWKEDELLIYSMTIITFYYRICSSISSANNFLTYEHYYISEHVTNIKC